MNQDVFQHLHLPPELAIEFMAVFSRFEHALKSTNYAIGNMNRVDAAWDRFANDIDARFNKIQDAHLAQCVDFLMEKPPRKQVFDGNTTRFRNQTADPNQRKTQQLLRFVRTIRNNLFHGGKYLPNGEVEVGRNKKLVESALYVLQICVRIDPHVLNSFEQ